MGKFDNLKSLLIFLIVGGFVLTFIMLMRSCGSAIEVNAGLSAINLSTNEAFVYADSTAGADTWFWEFGNGDSSDKACGKYTYKYAGLYRIRLIVNGQYEKLFTVHVKEGKEDKMSRLVEIQAPKSAMQGELIVFKAIGNDKQWHWMFGESGIVDSREQNPIYAYSEPGVYRVELHTENTKYPVVHFIEIYAQYSESDSTDVLSIIGADIRDKLQAIADGKSFNVNYNYIVKKYMCDNQKTEVMINNSKYNDIYSYCQGLRMMGKDKTFIEVVLVEIPDMDTGCVTKVTVIQIDKYE